MKKLYILVGLSLSLLGENLHEVIEYSLQNNYQLQILQEESEIIGQQAKIESTWSDPILKVGVNDLQSDQPLSRNVEAMQNQFVSLSQTIPLSNRLELSAKVEQEKIMLIEERKNLLQVNIAFGIRKAFIEAKNARENLAIVDEYISFLKQPMELLINLSAVERGSVERYIKTELLQNSYRLQRESWLEQIAISKERVELIGNLKIDSFEGEINHLNYHLRPLDELLFELEDQSPELKVVLAQKEIANKGVALAKAKERADITVTGGYYQRFDRDDYVSFSVAYPLFVRDRQSTKKLQAIRRANIQSISYAQVKVQLEQGLKITLHQLKRAYQELQILEHNSQKIERLIANAKDELIVGGSLVHYYELFGKRVENQLAISKKRLSIALSQNQVAQLLGEIR